MSFKHSGLGVDCCWGDIEGMQRRTEAIDGRGQEAARLEALARVAGAASPTSELDDVLAAVATGVEEAFGLDVVLNLYEPETGGFTVRAGAAGAAPPLATWAAAPPPG